MKIFCCALALSLAVANTEASEETSVNQSRGVPGTQMGFDLLRSLAGEESDHILISPLGITTALALLLAGADGQTAREISHSIGLPPGAEDSDVTRHWYSAMSRLERADAGLRFSNVSSVWARRGLTLNAGFLTDAQALHARVTLIDFSAGNVLSQVNRWARKATRGGISDILSEAPSRETQVFLLNAMYFKDTWEAPFRPEMTMPKAFRSSGGGEHEVPMMSRHGEWSYAESEGTRVVRLSYSTPDLAMYVVLPPSADLSSWLQTLDASSWETLLGELRPREGRVSIPRFQATYSTSLKQPLMASGVQSAFEASADFSRLSDAALSVTDIFHKTRIEVSEQGTEASAVTGISMGTTSVSMDPPFDFVADRPFFYAIRDDQSGSLLFAGLVFAL